MTSGNKKYGIRKVLKVFILNLPVSILILLFFVFVSFAIKSEKNQVCKEVNVNLAPDGQKGFLEESEIMAMLNEFSGGNVIEQKINTLNLNKLESGLESNHYIENAEVYASQDGTINIDIEYCSPVLRIISSGNNNYYLDESGKHLPLCKKYSPKVIVATGYIELQKNPEFEQKLLKLATRINKDAFLKTLLGQIHVQKDGEILLIPKISNLVIDFGGIDRMEQKIQKLNLIFRKILPYEGWQAYSWASVKYTNQIVLKRN